MDPLSKLGVMEYSLDALQSMPTLSRGQSSDLKIDTGFRRVWLSRCSIEDGEPYNNKVTIERLVSGIWETIVTYQAKGGE